MTIKGLIAGTVLALTLPMAAHAANNCVPRDALIERLESKYGEQYAGGGLQNAERVFEVWFSKGDGSWTILMTRADGLSCIMASGTNWQEADKVAALTGIPS